MREQTWSIRNLPNGIQVLTDHTRPFPFNQYEIDITFPPMPPRVDVSDMLIDLWLEEMEKQKDETS
jgi:hypothetical protein